jgi:hypothetical protein
MRRAWLILMGGLVLAVAGYACLYFVCTASSRSLEHSLNPELTWLKQEFHISDAEFARICRIHESYLSSCAERCRLIDEKNQVLRQLLATNNTVTPEIAQALSEAAQLRADCQKAMLQEFFEISRTMPSEQGRRYLAWVQSQTIAPDSHASMHH